jgi:hypothetical protein
MRAILGLFGMLCLIFILCSTSLRSLSSERVRKSLKLRLQTYDAQLDPSLAAVSGVILLGFGVLQSRISKSNRLLERIQEESIRLKRFRILELEGDTEAGGSKRALEIEIANLRQEFLSTVTFLKIPGLTLRFRVVSSELAATIQEREDLEARSTVNITQQNNAVADDNKNLGLGRVAVGGLLVSILFSLLSVMLTDPMSSFSSSSSSSSSTLFQYNIREQKSLFDTLGKSD